MPSEICPRCGHDDFTALPSGDRLCRGYLTDGEPCTYFETPKPPDSSGQFDVGAFVSDTF